MPVHRAVSPVGLPTGDDLQHEMFLAQAESYRVRSNARGRTVEVVPVDYRVGDVMRATADRIRTGHRALDECSFSQRWPSMRAWRRSRATEDHYNVVNPDRNQRGPVSCHPGQAYKSTPGTGIGSYVFDTHRLMQAHS